jgi:hypothetical protein
MILACLFDVGLEKSTLMDGLKELGIRGIEIRIAEVMKKGVRAKSFGFTCEGGPKTGTLKDIVAALGASGLAPSVKARSMEAFDILAGAEARVHGTDKAGVHFHEVGSLDSIVDVVGSFIGLEALGIEKIVSSPLALGGGHIECEHGTLPSPAPATMEIARGLPVRGWAVEGEMTTPTGAAILRTCASEFGPLPSMVVGSVGYGAGTRDLETIPNVMRLIVGEASDWGSGALERDRVTVVETNIDDMSPQLFSHVYDDLFAAGALDVWVENILMKKGRPAFLLSVLVESRHVPAAVRLVLGETTTSGVRLKEVERVKLPRRIVGIQTRFGTVKAKVFTLDRGERCAPEYEDCLRAAKTSGVSVIEIMEETINAFRQMSAGAK